MNNSQLSIKQFREEGRDVSMHEKIMAVMLQLRYAIKSDIGRVLECPEERIHKRLGEMQRKGMILKTDLSKKSSVTGKSQAIWKVASMNIRLTASNEVGVQGELF